MVEPEKDPIKALKSALLVGIYPSGGDDTMSKRHLTELGSLTDTLGLEESVPMLCPIKSLRAATFLGKGKIEEIAEKVQAEQIDIVIFDEEITPHQQKNIEEVVQRPVLDRTALILEVFAQRAQTKEAKIQVELAQSRYQLPRLKRMWTHLSRQKVGGGGKTGGFLRGTGEKQIEVDRRLIRQRIGTLERELEKVQRQRETQRKSRMKSGIPTVGIVGYTNVGKSTLLRTLTEAEILVEDRLFATLDTTTKKYWLPNKQAILLIDTVGFIHKLPHNLIAAFRSTLEEVVYTDILIHLVDASHPNVREQAQETLELLGELGVKDKPIITALNKIDLCPDYEILEGLMEQFPDCVCISALHGTQLDILMETLMQTLRKLRRTIHLRVPQSAYHIVQEIQREGTIISSEYEDNDILLEVDIPSQSLYKVKEYEI